MSTCCPASNARFATAWWCGESTATATASMPRRQASRPEAPIREDDILVRRACAREALAVEIGDAHEPRATRPREGARHVDTPGSGAHDADADRRHEAKHPSSDAAIQKRLEIADDPNAMDCVRARFSSAFIRTWRAAGGFATALLGPGCATAPAVAAGGTTRELVLAYDDARATGTLAFPSMTYESVLRFSVPEGEHLPLRLRLQAGAEGQLVVTLYATTMPRTAGARSLRTITCDVSRRSTSWTERTAAGSSPTSAT